MKFALPWSTALLTTFSLYDLSDWFSSKAPSAIAECMYEMEICDRGPIHKSYLAQWKSLAVRDNVLEGHWELADGNKMAQIVIPRNKVKEVLADIQGGTSGGHLGGNRTIDKLRQR